MALATLTPPAPLASGSAAIPLPLALAHRAVLALDLGTTTGWALRSRDGGITSGTMTFKPSRFEGGGMRYLRFQHWLGEVTRLVRGLERVVFEEVRAHVSTDSSHVYGGFLATLTAWCEQRGVPYEGVPVGTIKRFATGRGNADKAAMIAAIRARGFAPADDNEADAIALLLWAIQSQGGHA
jgi:Holliday junction resolvasome RuvABC endonuclease subunit